MPVLEKLRSDRALSRAAFREVGNNQKALYWQRLQARAGHPAPGSTAPPFEFDDDDWRNLFQLEAVVEFYANFRPPIADNGNFFVDRGGDPWAPGAVPQVPTVTDADRTADFLDPEGDAATVTGMSVRFGGTPDPNQPSLLSHVRAGKDTIRLFNDQSRPSQTYTIATLTSGTDPNGTAWQGVTLQASNPPMNPTQGATRWRINIRPTVVIIDPFGAREQKGQTLQGAAAQVVNTGAQSVVRLDGTTSLETINRARTGQVEPTNDGWLSGPFDTIYFPSDTTPVPANGGRPARTYRIESVDTVNRTVTIQGTPNFAGGSSAWHIPAGVSGKLPPLFYDIGPHRQNPNDTRGTDHYDGAAFVIFNGRVQGKMRTSTLTSRRYPPQHGSLSSVRGNARYYVESTRSNGSVFQHYCLTVEDFAQRGALGEAPRSNYLNANGQRFDGVRYARTYFGAQVGSDSVAGAGNPGDPGLGKTAVRLHQGNKSSGAGARTGSGSAGCLVSPIFNTLRDFLIDAHIRDWRAANPNQQDPSFVSRLFNKTQAQSQTLWTNSQPLPANSPPGTPQPTPNLPATGWNGKIVCTLWLIRPDERPMPTGP
jgi:hypothetical protein